MQNAVDVYEQEVLQHRSPAAVVLRGMMYCGYVTSIYQVHTYNTNINSAGALVLGGQFGAATAVQQSHPLSKMRMMIYLGVSSGFLQNYTWCGVIGTFNRGSTAATAAAAQRAAVMCTRW